MKCNNCGTEISNEGVSFCPSCGNYLREVKVDNIENNNEENTIEEKSVMLIKDNSIKRKNPISLIIILIVFGIVIGIAYKVISNKNSYYFADISETKTKEAVKPVEEENPEPEPEPDPEPDPKPDPEPDPEPDPKPSITYTDLHGTSKSGYDGTRVSDYSTKIIYDRQYFGQVVLKNKEEVYSIIKYDSDLQKNGCNASIRAIENEIITNYGVVAVNLCEMDPQFALELRDVIAYIYNSYPVARNYITNITLANVDKASYIASFMPIFTFITSKSSSDYPVGIKTQIILNSKYFLNTSKIANSVKYGSNNSYFPPNATRSSTLIHEFGHYLSYVALLKEYKATQMTFVTGADSYLMYDIYNDFNRGDFSKQLILEAYNNYSFDTGTDIGFDNFRASISVYAMSKDNNGEYIYDETIAEAFHDVYLNQGNAKPASRYIVQSLLTKL